MKITKSSTSNDFKIVLQNTELNIFNHTHGVFIYILTL